MVSVSLRSLLFCALFALPALVSCDVSAHNTDNIALAARAVDSADFVSDLSSRKVHPVSFGRRAPSPKKAKATKAARVFAAKCKKAAALAKTDPKAAELARKCKAVNSAILARKKRSKFIKACKKAVALAKKGDPKAKAVVKRCNQLLKPKKKGKKPKKGGKKKSKLPDYAIEALKVHNDFRATHGAPPLKWSATLAAYADNYAKGCNFVHSGGPYGENLACGATSFTNLFNMWIGEEGSYDPKNPIYSHFTQVVWKSSTELGCSYYECPKITAPTWTMNYAARYVVCSYNPPGNYVGQFGTNVQKNG